LVRRHIALVATLCAAVLFSAPVAGAAPRDASSEKLRKSVTLAGLTEHLENLQAIADANDGTRATGTPGYEASVDYVVERLTKAGYDVELDPFNYPTWEENAPSTLTFGSTTYTSANATDMITFGFSPSGSLSNVAVVPVDIVIHSDPVSRSTSGCEDTDFTSAVVGKIALIQRGTCPFVQKLANAEEAGAVGVVLFNEGNTPARQAPSFIEAPTDLGIPAVYVNYAIGKALYDAFQAGQAPAVSLTVDATTTPRFFDNVIAY
jgi:aminopeptidase Y